jgi:predicted RNase H-like nuclease (RuvC/YqgF family)
MREMNENPVLIPKGSPPSIASAMKALQVKIKSLEKENSELKWTIQQLKSELSSQVHTESKKLELEL